jgi:hypothetical protein
MYIVQVDEQYWLIDIWQGWLKTTRFPQRASVFASQDEANEILQKCRGLDPVRKYTVRSLT